MQVAVYPGSFDPITNGHLDIIERTARLYDKLIVGVLDNSSKKPIFTAEERAEMISKVTAHIPNVEVVVYGKLDLMITKYCPINRVLEGKENNCSRSGR